MAAAVSAGHAGPLAFAQLPLQRFALGRQVEQALAPIGLAAPLLDEAFANQLAQHPGEGLLGDAQNGEQLADRHAGIAADEVDNAVMGAAEFVAGQNAIRLSGEVAIGEEQQLDALAQLVLTQKKRVHCRFYVSHVDIFG